jgi:hypothetical protein
VGQMSHMRQTLEGSHIFPHAATLEGSHFPSIAHSSSEREMRERSERVCWRKEGEEKRKEKKKKREEKEEG